MDETTYKTEKKMSRGRTQRVQKIYASIPLTLITILINSSIVSIAQWGVISHNNILIWFFTTNAVSLLCLLAYKKHLATDKSQLNDPFWQHLLVFSSIASGLCWGAASIWLFPAYNITHQVFIAFVIAGMCAGAVTTLSANYSVISSFLILSLVPLIVQFLLAGSRIHQMMAIMISLFTLMMLFTAKRLNNSIIESMKARREKQSVGLALNASEKKYEVLFEQSLDGLLLIENDQFIDCNNAAVSLLNYNSKADLLNVPPSVLLKNNLPSEDPRAFTTQGMESVVQKKRRQAFEAEFFKANGELLLAEVLVSHIPSDISNILQLSLRDIGDRKLVEKYNHFRNKILEKIVSDAQLPKILEYIILEIEQLKPKTYCSILQLNQEGTHLVDCTAPSLPDFYNKSITGLEIGPLVGSCGSAAFNRKRTVVSNIATDPRWDSHKDIAAQAGLVACWSEPIFSKTNTILGTFAIYHRETNLPNESDIDLIKQCAQLVSLAIERKHMEQQLHQLASVDTLTGLANRATLENVLQHAITTSSRINKKGALMFIDLDNFKTINDTLGHTIGDTLLQQVAERLTWSVRESDIVARFGGDEFIIMLESLDTHDQLAAKQVKTIGLKILNELRAPYQLTDNEYRISLSIGATLFDGQGSAQMVLQQADIAMYQAKLSGQHTICFFNPQMQKNIDERVLLERELQNAIKHNELQLHYQLQLDSANDFLGAEALIRWQHPVRGMVPPLDFIPFAEDTGLIIPIGKWVIETACEQLKAWQTTPQTSKFTVAVNVSALQFKQPDFVTHIIKTVQQIDIPAHLLKLEITESMLVENIEDIIFKMAQLKKVGVQFSLDDFGTGYSSLQYLKKLPLDQLKIDQSFVRELETDAQDISIVRTIIAMAKELELDVIAEGVETQAQKKMLTSLGCHHFQGYLFAKPLPIDAFNNMFIDTLESSPEAH